MPISREYLTGLPNGKPLNLTNTTLGAAQNVHTANVSVKDECWIHAHNYGTTTVAVSIAVQSNGTSDVVTQDVPAKSGLYLVIPGLTISNGTISAYAASANNVSIFGYANRIT